MKQSIVDAIIRNAEIKSGIAARDKDICARRSAVTLRIRDYFLKQSGLTISEILALKHDAELIDNQLKMFGTVHAQVTSDYFYVNVCGHSHNLRIDGLHYGGRYDEARSLFADSGADVEHYIVPAWPVMGEGLVYPYESARDELMAIDADAKALRKDYDNLHTTLKAQLKPFRNVAALLKAWPEAAELIPATEKPQSTELALDVSTLNALCGVPSDDAL